MALGTNMFSGIMSQLGKILGSYGATGMQEKSAEKRAAKAEANKKTSAMRNLEHLGTIVDPQKRQAFMQLAKPNPYGYDPTTLRPGAKPDKPAWSETKTLAIANGRAWDTWINTPPEQRVGNAPSKPTERDWQIYQGSKSEDSLTLPPGL